MNIWAKMITALKGGINDIGESVIDEHALRILDQEIRDASEDLNRSKATLASLIAQQKVAEQRASETREDIKKHEGYVIAALNKDDEALALEVSERIAELENRKADHNSRIRDLREQADTLRETISAAEQQLRKLKQQTETIKATEALQRAQQVIARRHSSDNPKLKTALDSLDRIRQKQQQNAAEIQADIEVNKAMGDDDLEHRLKAAGITNEATAKKVLERIKEQKQ